MAAQHSCTQQAKIGAIEATLKHQTDQDTRIESNLKDLVKAVQDNQTANQNEFKQLGANFTKLETILHEQKKIVEESNDVQKEIKENLTTLSNRVTNVENDIKTHKADIEALSESSKAADERISKIEKWIIRVVAILTALGLVIEFLSNVDGVKKFFFSDNQQTKAVEQSNK